MARTDGLAIVSELIKFELEIVYIVLYSSSSIAIDVASYSHKIIVENIQYPTMLADEAFKFKKMYVMCNLVYSVCRS